MASFKQESVGTPSALPSPGFDMDQYLNLDGPSPSLIAADPVDSFTAAPSPSSAVSSTQRRQPVQQTFAGPSHQYEQYKQQTGLPVGALANTFALNEPDDYSYGSYGMVSANDGFFGMNTVEPDFVDFNTLPEQTPLTDTDMDFDMTSFMNPPTVPGAQNPTPIVQSTHPGRVWPGMHQQQAAMAKAQQQAQQQAAVAAHRQRSASLQSRRPSAIEERDSEDVVEDSISRLLNRMRNSSMTSSAGDDASRDGNGLSHSARIRKDEEDMDEDERLLASEEGKKLTSKERRQLRNKVSARAFRSRRKEYIGQLEGELAAKADEADKYRVKNQELLAENKRLTDLTRMLLSSPSFSQFLNDLSGSGVGAADLQGLTSGSSLPPAPQQAPHKDVNPNTHMARSRSNQPSTMGMTMIPEETMLEADAAPDMFPADQTIHYGTGLYDAQVYALPSLPMPVVEPLDTSILSGKTLTSYSHVTCKDAPEPMAAMSESFCDARLESLTTGTTDLTTDLYADESIPESTTSPVRTDESSTDSIFGAIPLEVALAHIDLTTTSFTSDCIDEKTTARFERLCWELEEASAVVRRLTAHI